MNRHRCTLLLVLLVACATPAWANSPFDARGWAATVVATFIAEVLAVLAEAWAYRRWLNLPGRRSYVVSIVANLASLGAGMAFCCLWTGALLGGSAAMWLAPLGAFVCTLVVETLVVAGMAESAGADRKRAARVALLANLVSWPLMMLLVYGSVIGVWIALQLSAPPA